MQMEFLQLSDALRVFAKAAATQGQDHIKPFHRYISLRLVIEGGFWPNEVSPRPPLKARRVSGEWALEHDPTAETRAELTVLGGMKTKKIDVVVAKEGIGPVVAVSVKGTSSAYRNLVNRMEEAIGDSTNLHVMYPGLVYGFMHLLRTNRETRGFDAKDMGIAADGSVSSMIMRYHAALSEMTGRRLVRNDFTRYESVGLIFVENDPENLGSIYDGFPAADSPLRIESFFSRLYEVYDLRFPFRADTLRVAQRTAWRPSSPLFTALEDKHGQPLANVLGYSPRLTE